MTKLNIWNAEAKSERARKVPPKPINLALVKDTEKVRVVMVNSLGRIIEPLVTFYPNGTIYRHSIQRGIAEKYGLVLDSRDKITEKYQDGNCC